MSHPTRRINPTFNRVAPAEVEGPKLGDQYRMGSIGRFPVAPGATRSMDELPTLFRKPSKPWSMLSDEEKKALADDRKTFDEKRGTVS